jgi:Nuclease-related domain
MASGDRLSYPRRLWLRHSLRAAGWALGLIVALAAGAALVARDERPGAVIGGSLGVLCLAGAWRERRLARRALVGARSEQVVRGALQPLARAGWEVRHSVRWPDSRWGGDIDHVAVAPDTGLAFAIETRPAPTCSSICSARGRARSGSGGGGARRAAPTGCCA